MDAVAAIDEVAKMDTGGVAALNKLRIGGAIYTEILIARLHPLLW